MSNIDSVWEERGHQQMAYLAQLESQYQVSPVPQVAGTLYSLVRCLKEFARQQIEFFVSGFRRGVLERCGQFPPETVLSVTLAQIGLDISVIEQVAEQRMRAYQLAQTDPDDPFVRALAMGDYLAYAALKLANEAGLLPQPATVLTYYQKSAFVRVIPYAPLALVGIPHSCIGVSRDFLAIPHEIGHYLYRYGRFTRGNGTPIERQLPVAVLPGSANSWTKTWFEEIFADVFGALVAGPVLGMSFQDLQMTHDTEGFYTDDGDHPAPVLRPYIYTNVIREKYPEWAERLHDSWNTKLAVRESTRPASSTRSFKRKNGHPFAVAEAITTELTGNRLASDKPLDTAVASITQELLRKMKPASWPPNLPTPSAHETAPDLYARFDDFVANISAISVPEMKLDGQNVMVGGEAAGFVVGETRFLNRIDNTRKSLASGRAVIPCPEWLHVFSAAGWATKGPDCAGTGGVC